jgi:hypothetical protein
MISRRDGVGSAKRDAYSLHTCACLMPSPVCPNPKEACSNVPPKPTQQANKGGGQRTMDVAMEAMQPPEAFACLPQWRRAIHSQCRFASWDA